MTAICYHLHCTIIMLNAQLKFYTTAMPNGPLDINYPTSLKFFISVITLTNYLFLRILFSMSQNASRNFKIIKFLT